jgi:hypothetical protein
MIRLGNIFSNPIDPIAQADYWQALERWPIEIVEKAISKSIRKPGFDFRPTPGQIVEICREYGSNHVMSSLLTEPPPTPFELTYGQWRCRFILWMFGKQKIGEKKVGTRFGYKTQTIWRETKPRWKEGETKINRQKLWDEFCKEFEVPTKIANVAMN